MSWLILFSAALTGFAALAMSMQRHGAQVLRRAVPPSVRRLMRAAGFAVTAYSGAAAMVIFGTGYGLVAFFAAATVCASIIVVILTYKPRLLLPLSLLAAAMSAGLQFFIW
jgi:small-conductance mechanosensitive channel